MDRKGEPIRDKTNVVKNLNYPLSLAGSDV